MSLEELEQRIREILETLEDEADFEIGVGDAVKDTLMKGPTDAVSPSIEEDATCKAVRNSEKSNTVWQSPDYKGYPSYGPRGDGKWGCTGGP